MLTGSVLLHGRTKAKCVSIVNNSHTVPEKTKCGRV